VAKQKVADEQVTIDWLQAMSLHYTTRLSIAVSITWTMKIAELEND